MPTHCGEGVPRRVITLTRPDGSKAEITICYSQWPTVIFSAYPKHPTPDPGPEVYIDGVDPGLMGQIKMLDMIHYISTYLQGETGKLIQSSVTHGLKSIQNQLPKGIELG